MKALVSTLRYVPDPARAESVNVGAAVACAELGYFKFRLAEGQTTRLRCFDPGFKPERLRAYGSWLTDYASEFVERALNGSLNGSAGRFLDEIVRLSAGDPLQVGPFRPVEFAERVTAADLDQLLADIVERDVRWHNHLAAPLPRGRRFETRVGILLQKAELYRPHGKKSPVRSSYRLEGLDLVFDYGYKNGVHHVIETADVKNVHDENVIVEQAAAVIVKFQRLEADGQNAARLALLSGTRRLGKDVSPTIRELHNLAEVFYLGEDQERRKFIAKVRRDLLHNE